MPEAFWQGLAQLNRREYYACHDTLEAIWTEAEHPVRLFYQGILQIAVALYHLENQNWRGAVMLLGQGIQRLDYFRPSYGGVDVETLITVSSQLLDQLHQLPNQDLRGFTYEPPQVMYQIADE